MRTIRSNTDISRLFSEGTKYSSKYITFIVMPCSQHDRFGRVAFIAGKKLGNAVWRNRAKRRLREIYRQNFSSYKGLDILMIAKQNLLDSSYKSVFETTERIIFDRENK